MLIVVASWTTTPRRLYYILIILPSKSDNSGCFLAKYILFHAYKSCLARRKCPPPLAPCCSTVDVTFVTAADAPSEGGRQKRWTQCGPDLVFGCTDPTCYYEKVKCRRKCKWKLKCRSSSSNLCYKVCMG